MGSPDDPRAGSYRCEVAGAPATLRWTEWGPLAGDPVVCVHGLTRTGRDFDTLAAALAARGRRVICPDIFGRGMSDWLPDGALYTVPHYAVALLPLLRALGRPFDWVGTSMGGLIGMAVAAVPEAALRRMVLNDIGPFIPAAALAAIADYLSPDLAFPDLAALEHYLRRVHAPFGRLSDAQWRHLARHSGRMTAAGELRLHYDPAIAVPARQGPAADADLWTLWDRLALPTLVLRGAESTLLLPETAARTAAKPGVQLATLPDCGHAPALMDPAQIAPVLGFLEG
ncbi:alpha/beta fold hydrolase [Roseomonas sp. BN140053]|uniref:alpha/beta fold hydrolase n=1 Tax=Roseomonas sp. BN140053 TaxID=3391898 RepID=UPI0039EB98D6